MRSLYLKEKSGDGFITQKIFRGPLFVGYEIMRLSTGQSMIQSLKKEFFPRDRRPFSTCGPFCFNEEGFAFADSIIDDVIVNGIDPVFVDEIGPLELNGKGHHDCFKKILGTKSTLYVAVRNRCVDDVISCFSLKDYSLMAL